MYLLSTYYRCKRHFIIYNAPWPQRTPLPGSGLGATRENTPTDYYKSSLPHAAIIEQRLKAAWRVAQLKRSRDKESEDVQERTSKKRKVEPEPPVQPRNVSNFSGRTRLPSLKVRERDGPQVKVEAGESISLNVGQRRSGRKRAAEAEPEEIHVPADLSPKKRRGRRSATEDVVADEPEHNPFMDEDGDDRRDKTFWPALPILPLGGGIRRTGLLNYRPNPTLVSRWRSSPMQLSASTESTPTLVDDDTDNEATSDEHPSTPENDIDEGHFNNLQTVPPEPVEVPPSSEEDEAKEVEELTLPLKKTGPSTLKGLGLITKPNPSTLAKRTWAPLALIIADPEDEVTVPQELAEPRTPPRRRRQDVCSTKSSPSQQSITPKGQSSGSLCSVHVLESNVLRPRRIFDDYDASSGEEVSRFSFT